MRCSWFLDSTRRLEELQRPARPSWKIPEMQRTELPFLVILPLCSLQQGNDHGDNGQRMMGRLRHLERSLLGADPVSPVGFRGILAFSVAVIKYRGQNQLKEERVDLGFQWVPKGSCGMECRRHGDRSQKQRKHSLSTYGKQKENQKWSKTIKPQSLPPVTCFYQQGSTS